MALSEYNKKRKFGSTPEPKGKKIKETKGPPHFVVQKHDASHLHYDFRLEVNGVLKSWAIPKGPSLNPDDKRLAMMVEDHPISYMKFEGSIPRGNYGAGDVIVWDFGLYASAQTHTDTEKELARELHQGKIKIILYGEKLKGGFSLVKVKNRDDNSWLLIKEKDEFAATKDITKETQSVISGEKLPRDKSSRQPRTKIKQSKKKSVMPHNIKPMLARLTDKPFSQTGWIFEIKWDGYRAISEIENGNIRMYSRNGLDFTRKYPPISKALASLSSHDCILDGEIVAMRDGRSDFHMLQEFEKLPVDVYYMVFDVLYLDGTDYRNVPLLERKKVLAELIKNKGPYILLSEHIEKDGKKLFEEIQKQGLEGIVAKDGSSTYAEGVRSDSWLKIKNIQEQEAIILGYTKPRGSRKHFGALVLGAYINGTLQYIGHSGGGFTEKELTELSKTLEKIKTNKPPITEKVPVNSPITWVRPKYVCQVKFTEWTPSGRMRHPIFAGLRVDKNPRDVIREITTSRTHTRSASKSSRSSDTVKLTHTDKIFWPDEGYTKGDVIEYYERISPILLPYLQDRPENLLRHPHGITGKSFFQKNITNSVPDFVQLHKIWSESNSEELQYIICNNKETLLYLVNLGCIELNPWNSRIDTIDYPDYMIIDLDPDENSFEQIAAVALEVHAVLQLVCEEHYVKTSGKTGIHICVPLGAKYPYDSVRQFAELIAKIVHQRIPEITSVERNPTKRKGKIYIDYLQNRRGQTLASVYSVRPFPGALVSTPLEWDELKNDFDPKKYTIKTTWKRIDKKGDLWKPILSHAIDLRDSMRCLEEHFHLDAHEKTPKRL